MCEEKIASFLSDYHDKHLAVTIIWLLILVVASVSGTFQIIASKQKDDRINLILPF